MYVVTRQTHHRDLYRKFIVMQTHASLSIVHVVVMSVILEINYNNNNNNNNNLYFFKMVKSAG